MGNLIGRRTPTAVYPVRNPGAPGALVSPLTAEYWVDNNFVGTSNGSILAPYTSLTTAYAAAVAAGYSYVNLLVASTAPEEVFTPASISCSIVGMSYFPLAYPYGPTFSPIQISQLVIPSAGIAVQAQDLVVKDVTSVANGAVLVLSNCSLQGLLTLTGAASCLAQATGFAGIDGASASMLARDCIAWGAAGTVNVGTLSLDHRSEFALLSSSPQAIVPGNLIVSVDDTPQSAFVQGNANLSTALPLSGGYTRLVYPGGILTANRTLTLTAAATSQLLATIDVYTQSANTVAIVDGPSTATLFTVPAGSSNPVRVRCTWNGANWALTTVDLV